MINLRRPTEAFIADGSITKEKIANGAVDASKIEDGAIDLTSEKVVGELPNEKLAIISDVEKLQDGLVSLAKTTDDVKLTPFVAGEVEQSATGTTEVEIIETGLSRLTGNFNPKKIRVIASLKTSSGSGFLKIYADSEIVPRLILQSNSLNYELVSGEFDVSNLSQGRHNLIIKISGSLVDSLVKNDYLEVYTVK